MKYLCLFARNERKSKEKESVTFFLERMKLLERFAIIKRQKVIKQATLTFKV